MEWCPNISFSGMKCTCHNLPIKNTPPEKPKSLEERLHKVYLDSKIISFSQMIHTEIADAAKTWFREQVEQAYEEFKMSGCTSLASEFKTELMKRLNQQQGE